MSNFQYSTVLVREPSQALPTEAIRMENAEISFDLIQKQWQNYVKLLQKYFSRVEIIPATELDHLQHPDSVFIEDCLIVGPASCKKILITNPGHETRKSEITGVVNFLSKNLFEYSNQFEIKMSNKIDPTSKIDGGDVLFTGQEFLVGLSQRTNFVGYTVIKEFFSPIPVYGIPVEKEKTLHLKCDMTMLNDQTILISESQQGEYFYQYLKQNLNHIYSKFQILRTQTTLHSNVLYFKNQDLENVTVHQIENLETNSEERQTWLEAGCQKVVFIDMSEFDKVDGSLTCCCVFLP